MGDEEVELIQNIDLKLIDIKNYEKIVEKWEKGKNIIFKKEILRESEILAGIYENLDRTVRNKEK